MSKEQVFQFFENVYQWSMDRKIIDPTRTLEQQEVIYDGQVQKLVEELNETFKAIRVKDTNAIKDGIGDVAVTMVNVVANALLVAQHITSDIELIKMAEDCSTEELLAAIANKNSNTCAALMEDPPKEADSFSCSQLVRILFDPKNYNDFMAYICGFAMVRGLSFTDCLDAAWNEIKDRKGHMSNDGIFIKE